MDLAVKQFRFQESLSYLVTDSGSSTIAEAALVDGVEGLDEEYRQALAKHRPQLKLGLRLETSRIAVGAKSALGALDFRAFSIAGGSGLIAEVRGACALFSGSAFRIGGEEQVDLSGLAQLPDSTLVFPIREENELLFSTLGVERHSKPTSEFNSGAALAVEKYRAKLAHPKVGDAFIDLRERDEFAQERIPGTTNLPLSELALHLKELGGYQRIYLSCLSGRRSAAASRSLAHVGLSSVITVVGGLNAWKNAGLEVEKANAE